MQSFNTVKQNASLREIFIRILNRSGAALVCLGPCLLAGQNLVTNPLDQKAQPFIDRYNRGLPTMVAPTLRQERSTIFNGVMTLVYTEVTRTAVELAPMNLAVTQRPFIFPAICKAPDTGRMLREGYSFRYLYYGRDGKLAGQLAILPVDCAAVR